MITHARPRRRTAGCLLAAASLCLLAAPAARADVFGRLRVVARDSAGRPLPGATVVFHDPAGVRPDLSVTADAQGVALSPPLEIRAWQVTTQAPGFEADTRLVAVIADTSTDVGEGLTRRIINTGTTSIIGTNAPNRNQTAVVNRIDQSRLKFGSTVGNPQSLRNLLITNPGFVQDSVNQAHPRGEHSATSIYLNGFKLPSAFQGRAGQVLVPETIQSVDVQTGGYAPEYGGETAAALNVNLRAGTITPFQSLSVDGGSYSTYDQSLSFGGQGGAPLVADPSSPGPVARKFGYFVNVSGRSTTNALEPPQPDNQDAHNGGKSQSFFGNFGYALSNNDQFTLSLEDAPAQTQIANRTGLPGKYASVGQGYGFGGARNPDGSIGAGVTPNADGTTPLGGDPLVLASQQDAGQDITQNDENQFSVLNYRHNFSGGLTGLVSYGATRSRLDIRNKNRVTPDLAALPIDSSVEFSPNILKRSSDSQVAASLTQSAGVHTYKGGFLVDAQSGDESYLLQPGSQFALDALYANDPDLAPAGTAQTDAGGNPVVDALGQQVYTANPGAVTPNVPVHRSGYYDAFYAQDTWRATSRFTVNYGLRYDLYKQEERIFDSTQTVKKNFLSPRLNASYALTPITVFRASYNKLFLQPPLAQGSVVGAPILPETYDDYNASIERQVARGQTVKLAYYYKNMRNQIDTNLLIPGTQIGVFTSVNFEKGSAHGTELSYALAPRGGVGLGAYLAYANSVDKPEGLQNTGAAVPPYNDHDTLNSLSVGFDYTLKGGAFGGLNVYHSSGTQSSIIGNYYPLTSSAVLDGGHRQAHTEVNLRLGGPRLAGAGGLEIDVQNLFNSHSPFNFNSGFSGTRFEQGRRVLLTLTGGF